MGEIFFVCLFVSTRRRENENRQVERMLDLEKLLNTCITLDSKSSKRFKLKCSVDFCKAGGMTVEEE